MEEKDRKELLAACRGILLQFDNIAQDDIIEGRQPFMLQDFWRDMAVDEEFTKQYGLDDIDGSEGYFHLARRLTSLAFAFGYAIGQTLDSTDFQDNEDVKLIQGVLRKEHLLPYVSREKKRREPGKESVSQRKNTGRRQGAVKPKTV